MLNTYIKNRGLTQTILHTNNRNQFNETNWDADYDGNMANISVTSNTDGNKKSYSVSLDNEDLANILNVPSINMPIDKRLQIDFAESSLKNDPRILQIEMPYITPSQLFHRQPEFVNEADILMMDNMQKSKVLESAIAKNYLSSPLPNEELIVPITIDEKTLDKYTLTPHRRHRHKKTHKTYKVYKKQKSPKSKSHKTHKSNSPKKHKSSKSKTKSRKTSQTLSLF
jgi:hypothetical protein